MEKKEIKRLCEYYIHCLYIDVLENNYAVLYNNENFILQISIKQLKHYRDHYVEKIQNIKDETI